MFLHSDWTRDANQNPRRAERRTRLRAATAGDTEDCKSAASVCHRRCAGIASLHHLSRCFSTVRLIRASPDFRLDRSYMVSLVFGILKATIYRLPSVLLTRNKKKKTLFRLIIFLSCMIFISLYYSKLSGISLNLFKMTRV